MKTQNVASFFLLFLLLACNDDKRLQIKEKKETEISSEPVKLDESVQIKGTMTSPTNGRLNIGRFYSVVNQWAPAEWTRYGDFNGDGLDDVVSLFGNQVFLKLTQGVYPDFFTNETWFTDGRYGSSYYTFIGDFNGDGYSDIAAAVNSTVYMKINNKNGGFIFQNWVLNADLWPWPQINYFGRSFDGGWGGTGYNVVGDFNGDGKDDIGAFNGTKAYMKLSTGSGFQNVIWNTDGFFGGPGFTYAMDYDGDGDDDVVSASGGFLYVKVSNRIGFNNLTYTTVNQWGWSNYTWSGDTNNNGKDEVITALGGVLIIRELNAFGSRDTIFQSTPNMWGGAAQNLPGTGYNWVMNLTVDGGDELVSAIGDKLFVH